jgi:hypothetical protein
MNRGKIEEAVTALNENENESAIDWISKSVGTSPTDPKVSPPKSGGRTR